MHPAVLRGKGDHQQVDESDERYERRDCQRKLASPDLPRGSLLVLPVDDLRGQGQLTGSGPPEQHGSDPITQVKGIADQQALRGAARSSDREDQAQYEPDSEGPDPSDDSVDDRGAEAGPSEVAADSNIGT